VAMLFVAINFNEEYIECYNEHNFIVKINSLLISLGLYDRFIEKHVYSLKIMSPTCICYKPLDRAYKVEFGLYDFLLYVSFLVAATSVAEKGGT